MSNKLGPLQSRLFPAFAHPSPLPPYATVGYSPTAVRLSSARLIQMANWQNSSPRFQQNKSYGLTSINAFYSQHLHAIFFHENKRPAEQKTPRGVDDFTPCIMSYMAVIFDSFPPFLEFVHSYKRSRRSAPLPRCQIKRMMSSVLVPNLPTMFPEGGKITFP